MCETSSKVQANTKSEAETEDCRRQNEAWFEARAVAPEKGSQKTGDKCCLYLVLVAGNELICFAVE